MPSQIDQLTHEASEGKADQLVVLWLFLLVLLETRVAFAIFQPSGTPPDAHDLSKMIEWPLYGIHQPSHDWWMPMGSSGVHGLVDVKFA